VLKVLIAEDDLMIADLAEEILVEHGYEVCGIARKVAEAVALGQHHKPDLAVLDLRLADGGLGTEIAARLLPLGRLGPQRQYIAGRSDQRRRRRLSLQAISLRRPAARSENCRGDRRYRQGAAAVSTRLAGFAAGDGPSGGSRMNDDGAEVRKLLRQQAAIARFGSFAPSRRRSAEGVDRGGAGLRRKPWRAFRQVCRCRAAENDLLIEA
jgi:CheY-like chemotaxis protein